MSDTDDLVRRLNEEAERWGSHHKALYDNLREAAAAIVERDQRIAALQDMVRYFMGEYECVDISDDKWDDIEKRAYALWHLVEERDAAERRAEAAEGDAKRYRWLRDNPWPEQLRSIVALQLNGKWDTAIDAAIAAQDAKK